MKSILIFLGGLLLGLGLAFLIGWQLFPIEYYDTTPAALRSDYKDEYVRLVSLTYQVEGSSQRALWRLEQLNPSAPTDPLVSLTERWIAEYRTERLIVPLVRLARDLGVETPAMTDYMQRGAP
ncbi:MAG: hypothetical protein JXA21_09145 [Anaerolineae bacterium]|nr:hypothetical protein [Anaerolineae bacterium]